MPRAGYYIVLWQVFAQKHSKSDYSDNEMGRIVVILHRDREVSGVKTSVAREIFDAQRSQT
jgi:hypothetical protein